MTKLRCDECDAEVVPVDGVTAIWDRGFWWCAKHCKFIFRDGVPVVEFPSGGKLVPNTILQGNSEGR